MKKIFTFLTAILLSASMAMQAQPGSHKSILWQEPVEQLSGVSDVSNDITNTRHNAPSATQTAYNMYSSLSQCLVQWTYGENYRQATLVLRDGSGNNKFYAEAMYVGTRGTTHYILDGFHYIPNEGNYLYSSNNKKKTFSEGRADFVYTGRNNASGDPIFSIFVMGIVGSDYYQYSGELPVKVINEAGSAYVSLTYPDEAPIPGCTKFDNKISSGYFTFQGYTRVNTAYSFMPDNVTSITGTVIDNNIYSSGTYRIIDGGSKAYPNRASAKVSQVNGFYFFDSYYTYDNIAFHVTMQYPDYQAHGNTSTDTPNPYEYTFDWDKVSLAKAADYATSHVVRLTAQDNTAHKKVVLDFVVDPSQVGAEATIPAGTYYIDFSREQNTVIASKGINTDLSVNNSYAGSTTQMTSSNYSTNPLWCMVNGTVTVEEGMSTITVTANQDYRGAPVDVVINGPAVNCTYEVAFNANGGSGTMANQEFTCGEAQNLNPNAFTGPAATITYNYHGATSGNGTPSVTVNNPFGGWEDNVLDELHDDEEDVNFSVSNGATVTMTAQWNAFPGVTLPTPEKTGYTFNGWYTEETGGTKKGNGGANFVPAGSITLHAQWTASNYTITYNAGANGTGAAIANGSKTPGVNFTLSSSTYSRTGYTQTGWSTIDGGAKAYDLGGTYSTDANLDLYPFWTANTHNVSWVTDGNVLTGTYTNGTTAYGTTIVAPNTPTKTATAQYTYTFNGWTPGVAATMPDNDVTYTATWTETPVNYTLTWTTDGDELTGEYTHGTVAYGTTIVAPTPTKTGYTFNGWDSEPAATMPAANTTYTAQWNANAYTVTFNKNGGTGDDMTAQEFTYDVAQNLTANAYTAPENKHFMGWATTAEGDVAYADGAEVSNLTATQNGEVELFAKWAYNTYTVVFNKNNEDATGTMANQAFTYGTAQNLTTNGFTLSGHDFAGWATEENGAVVYTNGEEVNNLTSVHEGTVNLYAKWREIFVLIDDKEAGDTYYTTTYANKKAEGKKLNVQYNRSFTAGRWATFALPFGYSFRNRENPTFGGQVYYLISAKYEQRGEDVYLTLNCMPNTTGIEANKPYVLIPNANITDPVFEDVKLKDIAENSYTASDMSGTGTIKFVNTTYRQRIDRADADENLRVIFLKNNQLYYPGGAVTMSAFRGYFYMMDDYTLLHGNQNAPVRVRLMTPDGEYIEQAPDTDQPAAVETKKYIENGILVIERAGMKYDAQGHIIK